MHALEVVTTSDSLATGDERRLGGRLGLGAGRPRRLGEVERAPLCTARLCRRRSRRRGVITCGRARSRALFYVITRERSWIVARRLGELYAPSWRARAIFAKVYKVYKEQNTERAAYKASDSLAARGLHDDRGVGVQKAQDARKMRAPVHRGYANRDTVCVVCTVPYLYAFGLTCA